jgi:hypothetical protein
MGIRQDREICRTFIDCKFLIREKQATDFREPIGPNHPQHWKLKKSTIERSQLRELR